MRAVFLVQCTGDARGVHDATSPCEGGQIGRVVLVVGERAANRVDVRTRAVGLGVVERLLEGRGFLLRLLGALRGDVLHVPGDVDDVPVGGAHARRAADLLQVAGQIGALGHVAGVVADRTRLLGQQGQIEAAVPGLEVLTDQRPVLRQSLFQVPEPVGQFSHPHRIDADVVPHERNAPSCACCQQKTAVSGGLHRRPGSGRLTVSLCAS